MRLPLPCCLALGALLSGADGRAEVTANAPAAKVYRISGVVVNSRDGSPIAHCRVTAMESRGAEEGARGGPAGRMAGFAGRSGIQMPPQIAFSRIFPGQAEENSAVTDERGRFSLTVSGAGLWRLAGAAHGFRTQAYEEHEGFWAGIALTPAAPAISVTLRLTAASSIEGVVFDEAGEAVSSAIVRAERVQPRDVNRATRGGIAGSGNTDDRGHYEITGLMPGEYRLTVTARPWYSAPAVKGGSANPSGAALDPSLDVVYPETWYPAATDPAQAEPVELSGGEVREADFHLTPMTSIHLRVPRESPPPGTEQRPTGVRAPVVVREDGQGMGFAEPRIVTASNTEWDLGGLSPGIYQVRTGARPGQEPEVERITIAAGSPTVVSMDDAQPGTVVQYTVEGVPEENVNQVVFFDPATGERFTSGGSRGRRRMGGDEESMGADRPRTISAPPGRYEVYLNGTGGLFLTGLTATGAQVAGRTIELGSGTPKLTIHAARGFARVTGVAKAGGKSVSGAMVLLVPASYGQPENLAPIERDETNTDGSFRMENVIPGEYIAVAIDHGWDVNWRDPATLTRYLREGTPLDLRGGGDARKEIEVTEP